MTYAQATQNKNIFPRRVNWLKEFLNLEFQTFRISISKKYERDKKIETKFFDVL